MTDFSSTLFNFHTPDAAPAPGSLLVAEPMLREAHFSHAVISLFDYEKGRNSMGVVLNRQISSNLKDLLPDITRKEDVPVYCGGPVSTDRLFFLHTLGPDIIPGAQHIKNGLWISGDFDAVKQYVNAGYPIDGQIRFFVGYSGWDAGQLESELRNNVWAVTDFPSAEELLESKEDAMWHTVVRRLGDEFRPWLMHPQNLRSN